MIRWVPYFCTLLVACPPNTPSDDDPVSDDTEVTDDIVDTEHSDLPDPATVSVSEAIVCGAPRDRVELGPLLVPDLGPDWAGQSFDSGHESLFLGSGLAVGDFDGDGLLDVFLPGPHDVQLYLQRRDAPGAITMERSPTLPDIDYERTVASTVIDVESDGDLDLFVSRHRHPDLLLVNDGTGNFTDQATALGIAGGPEERGVASSWADADLDGDVDLFVGNYGNFYADPRPPADPSHFYLNNGDGTFSDRTEWLPQEAHDSYTFVAAWHDFNGDGYPDLYLVNDHGDSFENKLIFNSSGQGFTVHDGSNGLNVGIQGMGLGLGDVNGDEVVEVLVSGWGNNRFMYSDTSGDHTMWFDAHRTVRVDPDPARDQYEAWGVELVDLDHDTDLDIVQVFGHIDGQPTPDLQPDEIYLQDDEGIFAPVGEAWNFDLLGQSRGLVVADLDDNGWLDMVVRDLVGPAKIYLARCGEESWLRVRLHAPAPNTFGLGAEVRVIADKAVQQRWVHSGNTSVFVGVPPETHFGLGELNTVQLEVRWPDGQITTFDDVPTQRIVDVHLAEWAHDVKK